MKIINRYVLKEHIGPFLFALSALTSLLLLQYIARKFGDLVGKGLSWQIIAEFFVLSVPFTVAMTLPMAVLVAVLYAFSRLASENEITALKAGGISIRSLLRPALVAATLMSIFMLWFNDQVLSHANHELATLQMAILRTKPTFALRPQVINAVKEGQLYLRADQIEQDESGRMRGVTIYDVSNGAQRRSIYADSGKLSFAGNRRDLNLNLFDGMMMSAPTDKPAQLSRIYYRQDVMKVRDVANSIDVGNADSTQKGEREMTVCEMQHELEIKHQNFRRAYFDSLTAAYRFKTSKGQKATAPASPDTAKAGGIGALYCNFITKYFKVREAHAAELPVRHVASVVSQDTGKKMVMKKPVPPKDDSVYALIGSIMKKVPRNKVPPGAYLPETASVHPNVAPGQPPPVTARPMVPANVPPAAGAPPVATPVASDNPTSSASIELADAKIRLEDARHWRNRYGVEIQKKFSLAFACIVFVLVGAPIALRFPRGGVGLVMGVGFVVFAIYYVGLIGGETLADKNIVSPFWAMWIDNIVFMVIGLLLIWRMGNEATTNRGGQFGERVDAVRAWFQRRAGTAPATGAAP